MSGKAWFASLNLDGTINWERSYKHSKDTTAAYPGSRSALIMTLDGGMMVQGTGVYPSLDLWLVKVDSLGCLSPKLF